MDKFPGAIRRYGDTERNRDALKVMLDCNKGTELRDVGRSRAVVTTHGSASVAIHRVETTLAWIWTLLH